MSTVKPTENIRTVQKFGNEMYEELGVQSYFFESLMDSLDQKNGILNRNIL